MSCSGGTYSDGKSDNSECTSCEAGKWASGGSEECSECEAGKYTDSAGSDSCSFCASGKYQDATDQPPVLIAAQGSTRTRIQQNVLNVLEVHTLVLLPLDARRVGPDTLRVLALLSALRARVVSILKMAITRALTAPKGDTLPARGQ